MKNVIALLMLLVLTACGAANNSPSVVSGNGVTAISARKAEFKRYVETNFHIIWDGYPRDFATAKYLTSLVAGMNSARATTNPEFDLITPESNFSKVYAQAGFIDSVKTWKLNDVQLSATVVDVLLAFGYEDARVVKLTGPVPTNATLNPGQSWPDTSYTVIEVTIDGEWVVLDPVYGASFLDQNGQPLNLSRMLLEPYTVVPFQGGFSSRTLVTYEPQRAPGTTDGYYNYYDLLLLDTEIVNLDYRWQ